MQVVRTKKQIHIIISLMCVLFVLIVALLVFLSPESIQSAPALSAFIRRSISDAQSGGFARFSRSVGTGATRGRRRTTAYDDVLPGWPTTKTSRSNTPPTAPGRSQRAVAVALWRFNRAAPDGSSVVPLRLIRPTDERPNASRLSRSWSSLSVLQ